MMLPSEPSNETVHEKRVKKLATKTTYFTDPSANDTLVNAPRL